jgi:hypothetical protein
MLLRLTPTWRQSGHRQEDFANIDKCEHPALQDRSPCEASTLREENPRGFRDEGSTVHACATHAHQTAESNADTAEEL